MPAATSAFTTAAARALERARLNSAVPSTIGLPDLLASQILFVELFLACVQTY
jgi:hypothetical protein